jgi:glycosyltransferase involved in cell wall biosynthesis
LGRLQSREIYRLYGSSSALIYPSYSESLGLPLIEAAQRGMPILAPELDYVRDVVCPVQTFDPRSPVSIARAVTRFMGKPESVIAVRQPEEFLAEIMR